MAKTDSGDFSARLFTFFKCAGGEIKFPTVAYAHKSEKQLVSSFEKSEQDKSTLAGLNVLHPQARKLLSALTDDSVKIFRLAQPLADELARAVWQAEAPKWVIPKLADYLTNVGEKYFFTVKIKDMTAVLFPTKVLAVFVELEPAVRLEDAVAAAAGKMILNAFYRMKNDPGSDQQNGTLIQRVFSDDRQRQSVVDRLGETSDLAFVRGLCGQAVTITDLIFSLIDGNCETLMGNRFVTNSFLNTSWDGTGKPFSSEDLTDLVRLARSESDRYLPDKNNFQNHGAVIRYTFENVVFALSGEGISCWVKPKADQEFLQRQFKERYQTIYLQLCLLALHQRYALVDLTNQLDVAAPPLSDGGFDDAQQDGAVLETLEQTVRRLRSIRVSVANFYLRAYFQQPAILTNHQQFYHDLQQVLGVNDLLTEVQQATAELDYIISDVHQRKIETLRKQQADNQHQQNIKVLGEINTIIRQQERSSHSELLLTLVVEFVGIPYYLHSFLVHAFHCPNWIATVSAVAVTLGTMGMTFIKFRKTKHNISDKSKWF